MTECKYSHTVFYPEMAWSGTNIACLKTCRHKEILVSLPNHVAGLSPSVRFFFFLHVSMYSPPRSPVYTVFHPALATTDEVEHVQADQTPTRERQTAAWPLSHQSACKCH